MTSPEIHSQQSIYDAIIRREQRYPYTTAAWSIRVLRNDFAALPDGATIFEVGVNTGESARVLSQEMAVFAPAKQFKYVGVDLSSEAITHARRYASQLQQVQTHFAVGDGLSVSLPAPILKARQTAAFIFAVYVGPSVGLRYLVEQFVAFGRPYAIIDRVYTPEQSKNISSSETVQAIRGFIRYFRQEGVTLPLAGLVKQVISRNIYSDPDYLSDLPLYRHNAPGSLPTFNTWLHERFSATQARLVGSFGSDTIIIRGNRPQ